MVMTSVSGHLLSLDFAPAYKNWKSCRPGSLFTAEVKRFCPENFTPIKVYNYNCPGYVHILYCVMVYQHEFEAQIALH
jgi:hypothetical protein